MKWLESCLIAISMYSKIPVPQQSDQGKNESCHVLFSTGRCYRRMLFRALALYCSAISSICGNEISLGVGHPLSCNRGHPYGRFMDTMDAVHSYGDRTKKLEILKDPHLGAFAVICAVVYLLLYTGSMYEFCENARGKAMFYPCCFYSVSGCSAAFRGHVSVSEKQWAGSCLFPGF